LNKKTRKQESISAKLSNLASKTQLPYHYLLTEFLIEKMAARLLTNESIKNCMIFKGGYVGLRVYGSERYTLDLDALLIEQPLSEMIKVLPIAIEKDLEDGTWFKFEKQIDLITQGEYEGVRFVFRAGLGNMPKEIRKAQVIHLDIGTGDIVFPEPMEIKTNHLIDNGGFVWSVYPLETIVAEKLHALVVRGAESSRSKDIFDLSIFLPNCNPQILFQALNQTFKGRGDKIPPSILDHVKNIDVELLIRGWQSAVSSVKDNPSFEDAYRSVIEGLQTLWWEYKKKIK